MRLRVPQAETVESWILKAKGAKPNLIPGTVHASARGKTKENIKSHESYQVYKVCSDSGKGAWGKVRETAHKTLATAHLGFTATSAAEVAANLAVLGFLSDTARSNRVDTLTLLFVS